jgi:hypothetical protein
MARLHGRSGRLYAGIASAGTAEPITFLNSWSFDASTDDVDVTAFGDTNKTYVSGLPDFKGSFAGFYDNASAQLYTAAIDGVARKTYLYPSTSDAIYWFGTASFDVSIETGVSDAVKISGSFVATSAFTKVG